MRKRKKYNGLLEKTRDFILQQEKPVVFFSSEKSLLQLSLQMVKKELAYIKRKTHKQHLNILEDVINIVHNNSSIMLENLPRTHLIGFYNKCEELKKKHNIGLVVIDNLEKITTNDRTSDDVEYHTWNYIEEKIIKNTLKDLAKTSKLQIIFSSTDANEIIYPSENNRNCRLTENNSKYYVSSTIDDVLDMLK